MQSGDKSILYLCVPIAYTFFVHTTGIHYVAEITEYKERSSFRPEHIPYGHKGESQDILSLPPVGKEPVIVVGVEAAGPDAVIGGTLRQPGVARAEEESFQLAVL